MIILKSNKEIFNYLYLLDLRLLRASSIESVAILIHHVIEEHKNSDNMKNELLSKIKI
jgi:hypothetical protein